MTATLFYDEPDADRATATVLAVADSGTDGTVLVTLDRTIFYPEGGGQPFDLGSIGAHGLRSVRYSGDDIVHEIAVSGAAPAPGDRVELALDRLRRRDHMQQHSGQHLLSAVLEAGYRIHTVSFHLGEKHSTIDVDAASFESGMMEEVSREIESRIAMGAPVRTHVVGHEEAAGMPLRKRPPADEKVLRIVEIEGMDHSPCAGTHVRDIADLRAFALLQAERYKGMTRLYFCAGDRALRELSAGWAASRDAAKALGCAAAELPGRARALAGRLEDAEAGLKAAAADRAELEVKLALLADGRKDGDAGGLRFEYADRGAAMAQETAKACSRAGADCVALSLPDLTIIAQAREKPSGAPRGLGPELKELALSAGGSGGGGPTNFRGVMPDAAALRALADAAMAMIGKPRAGPETR